MADQRLLEMIKSGQGKGADLQGADLEVANLGDVNLKGADLSGANLDGVFLYGANLQGANLTGAKLKFANLSGVTFYNANLYGANLYQADLAGAKLDSANLRGANLYGAKLEGASLYGAKLEGANLQGVKYNARTIWPKGFMPLGDGSGRMASRASKKPSGDPLLLNVNIDPRLLTQSTSANISGYRDIEDLLIDYHKGRVGERQETNGIALYYAGVELGVELVGCFKVPKKLSKELLIYFTKSMNNHIEYAKSEGTYVDEDTIKVHSYGYELPKEVTYELIPVDDDNIQTDEYEEEGELPLIGEITSFRAISANVTDTFPSWSKDYLDNRPKSLYISGTCEIAYGAGETYEVSFPQDFDYIDYPDRRYDLSAYVDITPGVIKTTYCVELHYEDLVKLRKMGKIASRNRKAWDNW